MFLGWRELVYYKKKYLLIITMLSLLLFMVLFLSGLANGLSAATSSTIENSEAQYFIISDDADSLITRSILNDEQINQIEDLNPNAARTNIQRTTIKTELEGTKIDCTYLIVDPAQSMMVDVIDDKQLADDQIILNETFIDQGIAIGDEIYDGTTDITLTVSGFTKNESYAHSPIGVITPNTYQKIIKEGQGVEQMPVQSFALNNADNLTDIKAIDGLVVLDKAETISNIPGHAQEQMTINMILFVLLFISTAILGIFFYVITIQKLVQFGTLKAIGTSMSSLTVMISWQVFLIATFSVIIGDILTIGLSMGLPKSMPFVLEISSIINISVIFIVVSIISSLFTLLKVAKVDPLVAIGGGE